MQIWILITRAEGFRISNFEIQIQPTLNVEDETDYDETGCGFLNNRI